MNFVSAHFFYFLLVVLVVYFSLPDRWRNAFLLLASYFFYGYWSVKYLFLLIFTMVVDYVLALKIHAAPTQRRKNVFLACSIVANLGILVVFKYLNLFSGLLASITSRPGLHVDLILPFGISFYTFHAMSYTIDVYRGVVPAERNFTYYSGYVMFFPQLVAGPIARASHLLHQFAEPKRLRFDNIAQGSWLIMRGYILKVVLADNLALAVDALLTDKGVQPPFIVLQGVYFFAFQIYFDFAGYTDIARGIAKLFDFDLVVNFRRPYIATSITEFWKRWHISLSTWLRDYLYISLGGNRRGPWKTYRNLLLTMLLGGLWHGANWTFLFWGGLHGSYLAIERALSARPAVARFTALVPRPVKILVTFHLVCLAWVFFRAQSFADASRMLASIADLPRTLPHLADIKIRFWAMVIGWMVFEAVEERGRLIERYMRSPLALRFATVYASIAYIFLYGQMASTKAFIYFQF